MQFKSFAVLALSAGALAAPEKRQATSTDVAAVLKTALPSSVALEYLTNSAGLYSSIASDLAVSSTPSWYSSLPTEVKSYFLGAQTNTAEASSVAANVTSALGGVITAAPNASAIVGSGGNVTSSLLAGLGSANSSLASAIVAGNGTAIVSNGTAIVSNGTVVTKSASKSGSQSASHTGSGSGSSSTASRTGSKSSSGSSSSGSAGSGSSSKTSTGGASLPTAIGMGLAGAVGIVGFMVL